MAQRDRPLDFPLVHEHSVAAPEVLDDEIALVEPYSSMVPGN
jgi:hypothetical protein